MASCANRELHQDRFAKSSYGYYLFNNRAKKIVTFSIERRKSIVLERRLGLSAPETMQRVEWKTQFAVDMLKYEAFILRCD